jgi:hypothetical protein
MLDQLCHVTHSGQMSLCANVETSETTQSDHFFTVLAFTVIDRSNPEGSR